MLNNLLSHFKEDFITLSDLCDLRHFQSSVEARWEEGSPYVFMPLRGIDRGTKEFVVTYIQVHKVR